MKPAPFDYHRPAAVGDVVGLLAQWGDEAKLLAGGQSLVPLLAMRLAIFPHLVDINGVDELATVAEDDGAVVVGAMVRQRTVERDALVRQRLPLLAEATGHIGHFQIRNRGTVGGSIAHADPAAEYPAVALAFDAVMEIESADGSRSVPADSFFEGLWTTALGAGDLLARVRFPIPSAPTTHGFAEVARRAGDFAVAGAAVRLDWDGERVAGGRLAFFGVDARPRGFSAADLGLVGETPGAIDLDAAANAASAELDPPTDIHGSSRYRRAVATVVARRALQGALEQRQTLT